MESAFNQYRPVPWDMIPDIGLYMDQVITYITRVYRPLYGDAVQGVLSPSMINNYVKARLIPRPAGKKYDRDQIALLTMIVALKQVTTMEDIRAMLALKEGQSLEALYAQFCAQQQQVIASLAEAESAPEGDLSLAMRYAIVASGYRLGCEAALRLEKSE